GLGPRGATWRDDRVGKGAWQSGPNPQLAAMRFGPPYRPDGPPYRPDGHATRLPNFLRFSRCVALRGGSLNSRAAVPPRMLCLAFSDRNGKSQIVLGRSKSQCG